MLAVSYKDNTGLRPQAIVCLVIVNIKKKRLKMRRISVVLALVYLTHLVKCSNDHYGGATHEQEQQSPPQVRNSIYQDYGNSKHPVNSNAIIKDEATIASHLTAAETASGRQNIGHGDGQDNGHHGGIHLISWKWNDYSSAIMFTGKK